MAQKKKPKPRKKQAPSKKRSWASNLLPKADRIVTVPYTLSRCEVLRTGAARAALRPPPDKKLTLCNTQPLPSPNSQFDHLHFNNETGFHLDQAMFRFIRADGSHIDGQEQGFSLEPMLIPKDAEVRAGVGDPDNRH